MLLKFLENDIGIYRQLPALANTVSILMGFSIHGLRTTTLTISAEKGKVLVRGEQSGSRGITPLTLTSVKEGDESSNSNSGHFIRRVELPVPITNNSFCIIYLNEQSLLKQAAEFIISLIL